MLCQPNKSMFAGVLVAAFLINVALSEPVPTAYYDEIADLPNHPETLLVDVREATELALIGSIPTSINVPLSLVETAFSDMTSPDGFLTLYGRPKPQLDSDIILTCRSGRRSEIASQTLVKLGYTNVRNYRGAWLDWARSQRPAEVLDIQQEEHGIEKSMGFI